MAENQTGMPTDKMEIVFDEVLWQLLDSAHDNGLTTGQVQTVWKAVKGFVYHENFDRFFEEKMNTDQEKFKTIYARAFNVERYLIEADQEQDD
ncbi:MAG: hypothetical protein AAF702_08630 [Chloroflexota bacterium]